MNTPPLAQMIKTIIAMPSVSSTMAQYDQGNLGVVHLLANWLEPLGFDINIQPIPGSQDKANIIATLGASSAEMEGGLVLSGHTDTVPFDEHLWQTNPFEVTDRDSRWYGLGICDMKSFLVMCVEAASFYTDKTLKCPLTILGTADEESSMSGARLVTHADLHHAKYALIGEPTGLKPINRHKGIMMLRLKINGASGHSSNPALGNNSLDAMGPVIESLKGFRAEMAKNYTDTHFDITIPTLNLGCIHGGDNPNRICDHVALEFDIRLLPGMNGDAIVSEIHQRITPLVVDQGLKLELGLLHQAVPPFENPHQDLLNTLTSIHNESAGTVAFATEAPFLTALGIETIVMGPGSIDQAHQPNEFLDQTHVAPTIAIIRGLIEKYCC